MKKVIISDTAPKAVGPYSQAIEANNFVFLSGQIPINPATGHIDVATIEEQTEQVLINIGSVLQAAGCDYKDVVKSTVFLSDLINFKAMNAIYAKYFPGESPARSTVQVAGLPLGALIEIECVAVKS